VNQTIYYGIWFTAVISIVRLAKDIRQLIHGTPRSVPIGHAEQKS
jgi:hypothetical protein